MCVCVCVCVCVFQWSAPQGGLLTSCSVSGDGEVVASATDIENGLYLTCADTGKQITFIKGEAVQD